MAKKPQILIRPSTAVAFVLIQYLAQLAYSKVAFK